MMELRGLTLVVERLLLSVQRHDGRRHLDATFVPQQEQEAKDGSVSRHVEAFNTRLRRWVPGALGRWLPQKRETLRSAQGNWQGERGKCPLLWHSTHQTVGLQTAPASGTGSSVLLGLFPGVLLRPLQIPFPSTCCPFPSDRSTYLASWMRTMMVHRPISPHTLAVPISAKTSTHSSTLSQVSSFCWGSDCKTQRGGGGQDAGSAGEFKQGRSTAQSGGNLRNKHRMGLEVTTPETKSDAPLQPVYAQAQDTTVSHRATTPEIGKTSQLHLGLPSIPGGTAGLPPGLWHCAQTAQQNFPPPCPRAGLHNEPPFLLELMRVYGHYREGDAKSHYSECLLNTAPV